MLFENVALAAKPTANDRHWSGTKCYFNIFHTPSLERMAALGATKWDSPPSLSSIVQTFHAVRGLEFLYLNEELVTVC